MNRIFTISIFIDKAMYPVFNSALKGVETVNLRSTKIIQVYQNWTTMILDIHALKSNTTWFIETVQGTISAKTVSYYNIYVQTTKKLYTHKLNSIKSIILIQGPLENYTHISKHSNC